jgi:hypothetical protein
MALVFKVLYWRLETYIAKKYNSFNYIKKFIFSFLSLFHVVMFFLFFFFFFFFFFLPLNFIPIYILFFIQIDYFSSVNFALNLGK